MTKKAGKQSRARKKMRMLPLYDRLMVRRIDELESTAGGILIPDTAQEKPQEGEVIAAGHGRVTPSGEVVALVVKERDRILFGKYSGVEIKVNGEELLILREEEVLCILK